MSRITSRQGRGRGGPGLPEPGAGARPGGGVGFGVALDDRLEVTQPRRLTLFGEHFEVVEPLRRHVPRADDDPIDDAAFDEHGQCQNRQAG